MPILILNDAPTLFSAALPLDLCHRVTHALLPLMWGCRLWVDFCQNTSQASVLQFPLSANCSIYLKQTGFTVALTSAVVSDCCTSESREPEATKSHHIVTKSLEVKLKLLLFFFLLFHSSPAVNLVFDIYDLFGPMSER